jgi:chromosome partitioning protein
MAKNNSSKKKGDPKETIIIVIANLKGGATKTTLAFHLACLAAQEEGREVLCLDLDGQSNLGQYLSGDLNIGEVTEGGVGLFLEGKQFTPSATAHPRIKLLHGHKALDQYDSDPGVEELGYDRDRHQALRGEYDVVIIDTPPAAGFRNMAPLCWADIVVIPMEAVMTSILGFQNVLKEVNDSVLKINPRLRQVAVINRFKKGGKSQREKEMWLRSTYGDMIVATLGDRAAVGDAMDEEPAQPVWMRKGAVKQVKKEWRDCCQTILTMGKEASAKRRGQ